MRSYFAAWGGFIASTSAIRLNVKQAEGASTFGLVLAVGMLISSVVLIIHLSIIIAEHKASYLLYKAQVLYSLVVCCIVAVTLCGAFAAHQKGKSLGMPWKVANFVFFILWTILASWVTFTGPFRSEKILQHNCFPCAASHPDCSSALHCRSHIPFHNP